MFTELTTSFNVQKKINFLPVRCITVFLWVPEQTEFFSVFSIQWILCFVDSTSRYMSVIKPTCCTIYLQFFSVTIPLHVSGLLVAHHQEVTMYICDKQYVNVGEPASIPTRPDVSPLRCTARTNCHIYEYTLLPPDDGLLASPKLLEI
jgi:hypothetical protein